MVSGTRALPKLVVLEIEGGSRAAAPKGSITYDFTHMGDFLLLLRPSVHPPILKAQIPVPRPKSQSRGPNPIQKAQIPGLGPKSHPLGSNPSCEAQI